MTIDMRKFPSLFLVFGCFSMIQAQMVQGVKFNKLTHDFGDVKEESEKVSTVFSFVNTGVRPLFIVKVETSCGCTTPEYTHDTIMPGDSGRVKAIYETRGRSGNFHKNLFVHFNIETYYQSLMITGNVIPEANYLTTPKSYSTTYSNLAFTSTMASFPDIKNTEKKTYIMKIFNYMGYPMRIDSIIEKPDFVKIDLGDSLIDVEDSVILTFTVDGSKVQHFGPMHSRVAIMTNDPNNELKFLHIYTNLKEDFTKVSGKQLKKAPHLTLDTTGPINFGKRVAGDRFSHTIKITNTGKSDLTIRSVRPSCSCVTFSLPKQVLKPGETVNLVLTIDTVNQTIAEQSKYVTILSNDPSKPETVIKLIINITN